MLHVGVDTGGTFTDFAWIEEGRLCTLKVPSTPDDPSRAVLEGLRAIAPDPATAVAVVLATTVATNALLTGRAARAVLVTTEGFEDVLAIGRQTRRELYALDAPPPPGLVPADRRLGVRERLHPTGRVATPLTPAEIARSVGRVRALAPDAVAVCLLHAPRNGRHERRLGRALAPLGVPVTLSHQLCPVPREFERTLVTVGDAAVAPLLRRHVAPLLAATRSLRLMMGDGGSRDARARLVEPIRTVLSGPAAGLRAASSIWTHLRLPRGIQGFATLDVGGTSADCGIAGRELPLTSQMDVGPYPFTLPCLDVTSVGAGGASIARLDRGGALAVGPASAGADPGPACYGRSLLPTVTDAFMVLGLLPREGLLGGRMPLDADRSRRAVGALARDAGVSLRAMARGILDMASAEMARGLRRVTLARGRDPRDLALLAFGGAGGLFAAEMVRALGFALAVVPPAPGALSALGALLAPARRDAASPVGEPLAAWPPSRRRRAVDALAAPLETALRREGLRGRLRVTASLDLCYAGQSHVIEVREDRRPGAAARAFEWSHARRHGRAHEGREVHLVALRAAVEHAGAVNRLPLRRDASPATRRSGPCVLAGETGTTLVPSGFAADVHRGGWLVLRATRGGGR